MSRFENRLSVCLRLVLAPSAHSHDGCPLQNQTAEVTHKVPDVGTATESHWKMSFISHINIYIRAHTPVMLLYLMPRDV